MEVYQQGSGRARSGHRQDVPYVTVALIAVNVMVFLFMEITGNTEETMYLYEHGAMYVPAVLEDGQWYRVLTHMFVHSGWDHIFNNMIMLAIVGYQMEREYGRIKFLITYFVSGLGATAVSALPEIINHEYTSVSVGASGAIMGLFGVMIVMIFKNRKRFGQFTSAPRLLLLLVIMVFGNMEEGIDWMAHLGGVVTGVIMAFALYRPYRIGKFQG